MIRVSFRQPPTSGCACNASPSPMESLLSLNSRVGRQWSACCNPNIAHFKEANTYGAAAVHNDGVFAGLLLFVPSLLRRHPTLVPRLLHEQPRWQSRRKSTPDINPQRGIHESATLTNIPHRHRITLAWSHASLVLLLVCMPFFLLQSARARKGGRPWNKCAWSLALPCD